MSVHSAAKLCCCQLLASPLVYLALSVHTDVCAERGLQRVLILPGAIYFTRVAQADVAIIMIPHKIRFVSHESGGLGQFKIRLHRFTKHIIQCHIIEQYKPVKC